MCFQLRALSVACVQERFCRGAVLLCGAESGCAGCGCFVCRCCSCGGLCCPHSILRSCSLLSRIATCRRLHLEKSRRVHEPALAAQHAEFRESFPPEYWSKQYRAESATRSVLVPFTAGCRPDGSPLTRARILSCKCTMDYAYAPPGVRRPTAPARLGGEAGFGGTAATDAGSDAWAHASSDLSDLFGHFLLRIPRPGCCCYCATVPPAKLA